MFPPRGVGGIATLAVDEPKVAPDTWSSEPRGRPSASPQREQRVDELGEEVGRYIREIFDADDVLLQLRTVQAIVRHLADFPIERARAACRRASFYGLHTYGGIKNILRKGLDLEPLPIVVQRSVGVLEKPRFARNIGELLELPLEETDASN